MYFFISRVLAAYTHGFGVITLTTAPHAACAHLGVVYNEKVLLLRLDFVRSLVTFI